MDKLNTSYNKANANAVAAFIGAAAIWYLNTKLHADIPAELGVLGQGAVNTILTWIIPNREV